MHPIAKPLESVLEEASEMCETPASEYADNTRGRSKVKHNREQTSIMSSKRGSGNLPPLEETVTPHEMETTPVPASSLQDSKKSETIDSS